MRTFVTFLLILVAVVGIGRHVVAVVADCIIPGEPPPETSRSVEGPAVADGVATDGEAL